MDRWSLVTALHGSPSAADGPLADAGGIRAALYLVVSGLLVPRFGIVHIVFGAIGISFAAMDLRAMRRTDSARSAWLFRHFMRMGGAYIATVTAFSAALRAISAAWQAARTSRPSSYCGNLPPPL